MGFREICQGFGIVWRFLMGTLEKTSGQNQIFKSNDHAAHDWGRCKASERRLGIPCEVNGQGAASSASIQWKTDIADSAPAKKHVCLGDIARKILAPNSGATISNVLVVVTGSAPLKRTEIRFADPEQVPAIFNLLAATLQSSGFDFHAARNSSIPATEIWLTCPVDDRRKPLLSCAAPIGEQVAAVAIQGALYKARVNNRASL